MVTTTDIKLQVSATQINEYMTCKRRWVAGYLLGLKQPQTEAMAFGEAGHKMLETYHKTGTPPDVTQPWQFTKDSRIRYPGLSAKKALKHIPPPGTGRSEHGFSFVIKGFKFVGYIDLEWFQSETELYVTDYKFVSSYQSALDAMTLADNVQATIYATKAIIEHNVDSVNLKWIYVLSTKNPSARPIETMLSKNQTGKQMQKLLRICEEMYSLKQEIQEIRSKNDKDYNEILNIIPPTMQSCSRYAGCYYINRCNFTPEEMMKGDLEEMDQNLSDKLKGLGLEQFIKTTTETPSEKPAPPPKEKETTIAPSNGKLDLSQFMKTPVVHTDQKVEKQAERAPVVQLNAPEHYEQTALTETAVVDKVKNLLTEEEIKVFLNVVKKVLTNL